MTLVGEILIDQTTGTLKDNSCTFNRGISQYFLNDRISYNSQTALGGCWKVFTINFLLDTHIHLILGWTEQEDQRGKWDCGHL